MTNLSAWLLTSHQAHNVICHINGRLGPAFFEHFSEGANFDIISTGLRALPLFSFAQLGLKIC